jgi:hypothetical protein
MEITARVRKAVGYGGFPQGYLRKNISFSNKRSANRGVFLRLYDMVGVIPLNTQVVARYEYPVFNLVVVAQRRRRRTEQAEFPIATAGTFLHVPLLSAI